MRKTALPAQKHLPEAILLTVSLTIAIVLLLVMVSLTIAMTIGFWQLQKFSRVADTTPIALFGNLTAGLSTTIEQSDNRVNILLLGTDYLDTRGDEAILTDTIMILSFNTHTGELHALSIPRDLKMGTTTEKINFQYQAGRDQELPRPELYAESKISDVLKVPIHHTLVISLQQVSELVDLIGGVEVNVAEGFIDYSFPRPDVDVRVERDPAKLYQTVEFAAGKQTLNGERALQYIRSRHADGIQGTDNQRTVRQQAVISALLNNVQQRVRSGDIAMIARLYGYYDENFESYLPVSEIIALGKEVLPIKDQLNDLSLQGQVLSIYPEDPNGVLFHPESDDLSVPWFYYMRDEAAFLNEVRSKLQLPIPD
ncbi:MAG: LCP family protein [bacterium]|nr:LCP family protein [bacterium]